MPLTEKNIRKNRLTLAPFDPDRIEQLSKIEREAFARFTGLFDELEAAIGMLHIGDHIGWKPLVLIHNKRTIRKYEQILDIDIRTFFPEEGPSAHRSRGYVIAKKIGNFWKAVSGAIKDDELKAERRSVT
jgi:hypothetical protein